MQHLRDGGQSWTVDQTFKKEDLYNLQKCILVLRTPQRTQEGFRKEIILICNYRPAFIKQFLEGKRS
ncbi:Hypothetical predicted protein [Cloeon dipterum]|uniref:Uncharacterized protein n=1 Tax=Cloeon dipterum TaxID=197152 RepID=A0A8S1DVR1_9INSE|nr:Hypothetical predicted protein [Cloeon dipterum]